MSRFALCVGLGVVLAAMGCKKHEPAPSANAVNQPAATSTAPAYPTAPRPMPGVPTAPVVANQGDVNANLGQLSMELRRYVVRTRSVPKNFEEFAAKSRLQAPPPPPGKKYAIEGQAVVLVKR